MKRIYGLDSPETDKFLTTHKIYKTLIIIDGKGFARFNVNGYEAEIIDTIIMDGDDTMLELMRIGQSRFPYVTHLKWRRVDEHKSKKKHRHKVYNFRRMINLLDTRRQQNGR